jgi:electron transfer flavoprotein beta subunit
MVEAPLPVMIAVLREINRPRYPTVPMRLFAQDAPVTLWNNKEMGLREDTIGLKGSATQVRKIFSPQRERGEIIGDGVKDPQASARLLVERLKEKNILSL